MSGHPPRKTSAAQALLAGMSVLGGNLFFGPERAPERAARRAARSDEQGELEMAFLATLSGGAHDIWSRRIARGLSESELAFIRGKIRGGGA